jgi:hypothetical protein
MRVLDKEHGNIISNEVPISFIGIELNGKPPHVTRGIGRTTLTGNRGEANRNRRAFARLGE